MSMEKAPLLDTLDTIHDDSPPTLPELNACRVAAHKDYLTADRAYLEAWRLTPSGRRLTAINNAVLGVICLFGSFMVGGMLFLLGYAILFEDPNAMTPRRVELEAHVMSKCPDTRDCLRDLVLPAMQQVAPYVDFTLSYIGNATAHDDTVICMHGPSECLGNIIELCAAKLHPDPKIYLGFTMCLTRDYQDIPSEELLRACALEHGMSFDKLNDCASRDDGAYGIDLLRNSMERSADAGVATSCTVRLDGKQWCVRDDGTWRDCEHGHEVEDLVDDIMRLRTTIELL